MMANTSPLSHSAWFDPGSIHGGQTPQSRRLRFYKGNLIVREAPHRCRKLGFSCKERTGTHEEIVKTSRECRVLGRASTNTYFRGERWIASHRICASLSMFSNPSGERDRWYVCYTIYRIRPGSFTLQSCTDANGCIIDNLSGTGPVSRRQGIRCGAVWSWVWDSSKIM